MVMKLNITLLQARNQLATSGGVKSFLRGPKFFNYVQYFQTMSNTFFQGRAKLLLGGFDPPAYSLHCSLHVFLAWVLL